jgi:hypothetical protein
MEAHRIVRRRGSQIFYKIDSQMAVRFSTSRAGRPLPPRTFLNRHQGHSAAARIRFIEKSSDLTPRPSGLEHSASTKYATAYPNLLHETLQMASMFKDTTSLCVKRKFASFRRFRVWPSLHLRSSSLVWTVLAYTLGF